MINSFINKYRFLSARYSRPTSPIQYSSTNSNMYNYYCEPRTVTLEIYYDDLSTIIDDANAGCEAREEERRRNANPAALLAWEHYKTILALSE